MLTKLKRFFDTLNDSSNDKKAGNTLHLTQIASVSLLINIAKVDLEFGQTEFETIIAAARALFALSDEETETLVELAHQHQHTSTSLYEFTAAINHSFDAQQKYDLIKAMWAVAFADGTLDRYEEHLIRRVADLIYVPHVQFIQAKLEVAQKKQEELPR